MDDFAIICVCLATWWSIDRICDYFTAIKNPDYYRLDRLQDQVNSLSEEVDDLSSKVDSLIYEKEETS
jgi:hypothetical protein